MSTRSAILDSDEITFSNGVNVEDVITELNEQGLDPTPEHGREWTFTSSPGDWGADELLVGVRGTAVGALMWMSSNTVMVPAGGSYTHWVPYFSRYGHHFDVPSGAELPIATVHEALREYARTGQRPTCVEWVPEGDVRPSYPALGDGEVHA